MIPRMGVGVGAEAAQTQTKTMMTPDESLAQV